jgi:hypothetical protein
MIVIIAGDLNARVGKTPVKDVPGTCGEEAMNNNCRLLIDFATYNNLKINTFYCQKDIHKYT